MSRPGNWEMSSYGSELEWAMLSSYIAHPGSFLQAVKRTRGVETRCLSSIKDLLEERKGRAGKAGLGSLGRLCFMFVHLRKSLFFCAWTR